VCGRDVRWPTLDDWVIFEAAKNPFFVGGERTISDASNILWRLGAHYGQPGCVSKFWRRYTLARIMGFAKGDADLVCAAVGKFVDDAFLDCPGTFSFRTGAEAAASAVSWPRKSYPVDLCGEIMSRFPSFTFSDLRALPLPMFWQWLHLSRETENPEYRPTQLTDWVNMQATAKFNEDQKAAREVSAQQIQKTTNK